MPKLPPPWDAQNKSGCFEELTVTRSAPSFSSCMIISIITRRSQVRPAALVKSLIPPPRESYISTGACGKRQAVLTECPIDFSQFSARFNIDKLSTLIYSYFFHFA